MRRISVDVLTIADGSASVDTPVMNGFIESIVVDEGTWTDGTADVTITDKVTGQTILTITNANGVAAYPVRDNICGQTGADIAAAATATDVYKRIPIAGKAHIAVAQGGDAKTGKVHFLIDDGSARIV